MAQDGRGNRQVRYLRRPVGRLEESSFVVEDAPMPVPAEGEVLLRTLFLSIDPYMRRQMLGVGGYAVPLREGDVMQGRGIAEVMESRHPAHRPGDVVFGEIGWRLYAALPGGSLRPVDRSVRPLSLHLGLLGSPGLTAWVGLTDYGRPQPGETVVVSAAAGAVGSLVGQIAKLRGCRAIGIAGGAEKCAHVVRDLGFDACLDYRADGLEEALRQAAPGGVQVYFDNVGGAVLDAVLPNLAMGARIALCGMIAHYNATGPVAFRHLQSLLDKCVALTGFRIGFVPPERRAAAAAELMEWFRAGKLRWRETVSDGLETAPSALVGLFEGANTGKRIVRVAPGEG